MVEVKGRCMKCKQERVMKNPEQIKMKNGNAAVKGTCPVCGTKMFKIGSIGGKKGGAEEDIPVDDILGANESEMKSGSMEGGCGCKQGSEEGIIGGATRRKKKSKKSSRKSSKDAAPKPRRSSRRSRRSRK